MSDPTQPTTDEPDARLLGSPDGALVPGSEEPLDRDIDDDAIDSAEADERAAREGSKGEPQV